MACFDSLLARRVLLWYILLGSILLFPLTYNLTLDCKFILIGVDSNVRKEYQSFGVFKASVYDEFNGGTFLGCVNYSQFWQEQTNDIAFRSARYAGGLLMGFTTLATVINLCLQCFNKHGKSWLWGVMRLSYICALICQGAMYSVFSSEICTSFDGNNSQCWMGRNGVAGVFNFVFLLGMVIATFHSYPPKNPVFQCWGGECDDYESSMDNSTDDEEVIGDIESAQGGSFNHVESVSLFGDSRAASRKSSSSKRSRSSKKGEHAFDNKTILENATEEDKLSIEGKFAAETTEGLIANESSAAAVVVEPKNYGKETSSLAGSLRDGIANRFWAKKKTGSSTSVGSFKGVADRVTNIETGINRRRGSRAGILGPELKASAPQTYNSSAAEIKIDKIAKAKQYPQDSDDTESIRFLRELAAVTKLEKGGLRVKTVEKDRHLEIVDEYPAKAKDGLNTPHSIDGGDVVKVRTEYYDQGSRTTKEVTHHDGSRTVITTIDSKADARNEINTFSSRSKKEDSIGEKSKGNEGDAVQSLPLPEDTTETDENNQASKNRNSAVSEKRAKDRSSKSRRSSTSSGPLMHGNDLPREKSLLSDNRA